MSSADQAGDLDIKKLPIPSEQRQDVFVATPNGEMEECWLRYGGASVFHHAECSAAPEDWGKNLADFCGVAIFRVISTHEVPREVFEQLEPFFKRAGAEANVFEYCPVRKMFTRRDADWFQGRVV